MFDLGRFADDVGDAYQRDIVGAGKEAHFILLVSFLLTFAVVRFITHSIRAHRFQRIFHNVGGKGGLHIHHLVPGIILLLVSGYVAIAFAGDISVNFTAVLFGIGAALTLDEFALWLHLEDVYWAKEGRDSIDAVVIAATVAGIGLLGNRFFIDLGRFFLRLFGWESV